MNNTHTAAKAGSWYPANPSQLSNLMQEYENTCRTALAATDLSSQPCYAAICPHAGLAFSGLCAAKSFYALAQKHPHARTIIIFGAVHSYCTSSAGIWASGKWQTPLGDLAVDTDLANKILQLNFTEEDYLSQLNDNAIELQTPLLKHFFPESMILPVSIPASSYASRIGEKLAELTRDEPDKYLAIGSSDLTHYGSVYGFAPAGDGIDGINWARANDRRLIAKIEALAVPEIIPEASANHNACGSGAITATMSYALSRGVNSGTTLEHVLSYDIMPSDPPELSVGYCSIVF